MDRERESGRDKRVSGADVITWRWAGDSQDLTTESHTQSKHENTRGSVPSSFCCCCSLQLQPRSSFPASSSSSSYSPPHHHHSQPPFSSSSDLPVVARFNLPCFFLWLRLQLSTLAVQGPVPSLRALRGLPPSLPSQPPDLMNGQH